MIEKNPKTEQWLKSTCIHCEKDNWHMLSDQEYRDDVEAIKCHNCKKEYWLNYQFTKEMYHGQDVTFRPEDFDEQYHGEDGLPEPK